MGWLLLASRSPPSSALLAQARLPEKYQLIPSPNFTSGACGEVRSSPGFRSILLGAKSEGRLIGVMARVPYEQDGGLFCHNLSNMRTQLQTLLDGLTVKPAGAAPAPAAAAPPAPPTS